MVGWNNFKNSLELGQKYEDLALQERLISKNFTEYEKAPNRHFPDWDFRIKSNENWFAYEVKADTKAYNTRNLFVEYEHTNIPSGISLTKSDYHLFFILDPLNFNDYIELIECETRNIKEFIEVYKPRTATCKNEGWNPSYGYLINIEKFMQF